MALAANTFWEFRQNATASMVNGGGFNIANANFLTDLTTDSNTANTASPVVSSASYNFVAGDVGASIYISAGTNWTKGWYPIASVASNKATLSAAVGEASVLSSTTGFHNPNTVVGCATVGTPTSGTFGIDYSQQTAAEATATDITCTAGSTTVTSASALFTRMMVGNIIHFTALTGTGAIVGWYEIVNYTDTSNVVLDRTPTNGVNNITAGTYYVGGALSLNSTLDDDFFEIWIAGHAAYFKYSATAFTTGESISTAATTGTSQTPCEIIGYNSVRGDNPTGSTRPILNYANTTCTFGTYTNVRYMFTQGTVSTGFSSGTGSKFMFCKHEQTSTTASRPALSVPTDGVAFACEAYSINGNAILLSGNTSKAIACYARNSNRGIHFQSTRQNVIGNIIHAMTLWGISLFTSSTSNIVANNTIHGFASPRAGTAGIGIAASVVNLFATNNLISGWAEGIGGTTTQQYSNVGYNNALYNNTADASLYSLDASDITGTNPSFTDVTEIVNLSDTATSSGSVLTDTSSDFSTVTDNVDVLHVFSGTGVTVANYLITSHTSTTVTVNNALGTSSAGDIVYSIPTGRNFKIGTALKGLGYPGIFAGAFTTGYMDPGAVQRQEAGSGSVFMSAG